MAELAAAALVVEQVVSTSLEVGAAATIARPTQPLQASLAQLATTPSDDQSLALARSHHTVTVIDNKAYIFGGQLPDGKLCTTDVHAISIPSKSSTAGAAEYACYPAFPLQDTTTGEILVPSPRAGHAAAARGKYVLIYGGRGAGGEAIAEDNCIWMWDSETLKWNKIHAVTQIGTKMAARFDHKIFVDEKQDILILHGGTDSEETWFYDFNAVAWTELPSCPSLSSASAFVDGVLYSISSNSDADINGTIYSLKIGSTTQERLGSLKWEKLEFPSNALTPGPRPRSGAALVPITSGVGRRYLSYILGARPLTDTTSTSNSSDEAFYSDIWILQLPSQAFSAAAIKDVIRDRLPGSVSSGAMTWSELEILPVEQTEHAGKVHPGPRGFFGAASCLQGKGVVFWGGVNARGENEADGWLLTI